MADLIEYAQMAAHVYAVARLKQAKGVSFALISVKRGQSDLSL
jgi:hypothetical protein